MQTVFEETPMGVLGNLLGRRDLKIADPALACYLRWALGLEEYVGFLLAVDGRRVVELYGFKRWSPGASVWALEPWGLMVPLREAGR